MPPDYSDQNLRGRSFKGQNLKGANFSYADIRSTDFSGSNLTGANFTGAKAGLQRQWATFLVVVSWLLMGISGFLSGLAGALVASSVFSKPGRDQIPYQIAGWIVVIILVVFFFVTIRQGIQAGLGIVAVAVAIAIAIAITIPIAGAGAGATAIAIVIRRGFCIKCVFKNSV